MIEKQTTQDAALAASAMIEARFQEEQKFLVKTEVATIFQATPRTIDKWMADGILPYFKIGRSVRFRLSDIHAHMEAKFRRN